MNEDDCKTTIAFHYIRDKGWVEETPVHSIIADNAYDSATERAIRLAVDAGSLGPGKYIARYDDTEGITDRGVIERMIEVTEHKVRRVEL